MEKTFPATVEWAISSYSMRNEIRNCVQIGKTPDAAHVYLGDSQNPDLGALTLGRAELGVLLRTAAA